MKLWDMEEDGISLSAMEAKKLESVTALTSLR